MFMLFVFRVYKKPKFIEADYELDRFLNSSKFETVRIKKM